MLEGGLGCNVIPSAAVAWFTRRFATPTRAGAAAPDPDSIRPIGRHAVQGGSPRPLPTIYQARCERCSYASDLFTEEYGAVFTDNAPADRSKSVVAGLVLHDTTADASIAETADPRLVVLPHPIESHVLAETGYTWATLARAGRYVRVRRVVCRECGTLYEIRRLAHPPALGCLVGCLCGLAAGAAGGLQQRSFWIGLGIAYAASLASMTVAELLASAYTRRRFRERALEVAGSGSCPRCESTRYEAANSRRVSPCPRCSERSLRVRAVGFS